MNSWMWRLLDLGLYPPIRQGPAVTWLPQPTSSWRHSGSMSAKNVIRHDAARLPTVLRQNNKSQPPLLPIRGINSKQMWIILWYYRITTFSFMFFRMCYRTEQKKLLWMRNHPPVYNKNKFEVEPLSPQLLYNYNIQKRFQGLPNLWVHYTEQKNV